ncbi:hypothetical protein ACVWZM_005816 [Bradyrhizobium sp. USDA 4501]
MPWMARATKRYQKPSAKAAAKVETATRRMVNCSTRTRPNRSAAIPATQPPRAVPINELEARMPASGRDRLSVAISAGVTSA